MSSRIHRHALRNEVQDIRECLHRSAKMSSVMAIGCGLGPARLESVKALPAASNTNRLFRGSDSRALGACFLFPLAVATVP